MSRCARKLGDDEPRALGCAARSARGDGRPKPFCILEAHLTRVLSPPSPVSQFQNPVFYYFLLGCCLAAAAFNIQYVSSFNNVATIESLHGRGRLFDDASARGPSAWNNRTMSKGVWCSDSAQCGPLQRTIRRLERVWRGPRPTSGPPVGICEKGPVDGLYIVTDFLSIEEVELLRDLFSAHHGWAMYNWGNVGRRNELASVLQRIDFGLPEMTAEGVAASGSNGTQVQPIGELQQHVISLLEMRMRAHFGEVAWGGEDPTPEHRPNMLQFTRIAPGTCLGNHFDRRDKWEEGIASIAWGQAPGQEDSRGDPVRACMHACIPHTMHARSLSCLCNFGSPPPFVRLFAFRLFVCAVGAQDAVRPAGHRPKGDAHDDTARLRLHSYRSLARAHRLLLAAQGRAQYVLVLLDARDLE